MAFTAPKHQIPDDWLTRHGPELHARFVPWLAAFQQNNLTGVELSAIYLLLYTTAWRGPLWHNGLKYQDSLGTQKSAVMIGDLQLQHVPSAVTQLTVMEVVSCTRLRGVSARAQRALLGWHAGTYSVRLSFEVPEALELLQLQARGERVVTLFVTPDKMAQKNLERDPLTFLLHDLEHADEFFHDPLRFHEQKLFYAELHQKFGEGQFSEALQDEKFKHEFDYVISDMNSHPAHLRATLAFLLRDHTSRNAKVIDVSSPN